MYPEERPGTIPAVLEVAYVPVEPFWVLIEPEDSGWDGCFLYTCSEDDAETGATWYPTVEAAKASTVFQFGWSEKDRWVCLPDDVWDVAQFAQYWR